MMESRGADRIEIEAAANFRRGAGLAQSVSVADLTRGGCRLIDIPRTLSRGERVSLRIGGVGPIVAEVRWLKLGREAGLEFVVPLGQAMYSALVSERKEKPLDPYQAEIMGLHNSSHEDSALVAEAENVVPIDAATKPETPHAEKRRSTRFDAGRDPATLEDPDRGPVAVSVIDFSQHGLRIVHDGIAAKPGSRISLIFPDGQVVDGEVRWNDGTHIGVLVVEMRDEPVPVPHFVRDDNQPAECASAPAPMPPRLAGTDLFPHASNELPDVPEEHLERFAKLLESARACDFVTVKVRADADGITMELKMKDPE